MDSITRCGIVTTIGKNSVTVCFSRSEACGSCAAKNACGFNTGKPVTVEVETDNPEIYQIGQSVTLEIAVKNAMVAALWAYVLPLFLMLAALFGALFLGTDEMSAAIWSLLILAAYYIVLFLFRHHFKPQIKIKLQ